MAPVQLSSLSDFEREISTLQNSVKAGGDCDDMARFQMLYKQFRAKAGFFSGYQLKTLKEKIAKLELAFTSRGGKPMLGQLEIGPGLNGPLSAVPSASPITDASDLLSDNRLVIADLTDVSASYEVNGRDVVVERCKNCRVNFVGAPASLKVANCTQLALLASAICTGSVYVDSCQDCQLHLGGEQVRIHDSRACVINLFTRTGCILENSYNLHIGPMDDVEGNQWKNITDFSFSSTASYCIKE